VPKRGQCRSSTIAQRCQVSVPTISTVLFCCIFFYSDIFYFFHLFCSDYEKQLLSRDDVLASVSKERNAALRELQNLKTFLRDRCSDVTSSKESQSNKSQLNSSTEDLMQKSIDMNQPMLLRVSKKSLRQIPRPIAVTPPRRRVELQEHDPTLLGDSLKGVSGTGFVML
jgi:hypothetical protein